MDLPAGQFVFLKGAEDAVSPKEGGAFNWDAAASRVREQLHDALNAKNLAFLFGSGCSSLVREDRQLGIDTMSPLAKDFLVSPTDLSNQLPGQSTTQTNESGAAQTITIGSDPKLDAGRASNPSDALAAHDAQEEKNFFPSAHERQVMRDVLGIDIGGSEFSNNLERLMEALYSLQFVLRRSTNDSLAPAKDVVASLIKK